MYDMELIRKPDAFFQILKERENNMLFPLLIVGAAAMILSIQQFFIFSEIFKIVPIEQMASFYIAPYSIVILTLAGYFSWWLILAAIMYIISLIFGGKGSFRRTFEFTGYGFLPNLISLIILTPINMYYIMNVEITSSEFFSEFVLNESLIQILLPEEVIQFNFIVNLIATLWSVFILTSAMKWARNLETKGAIITASIPMLLYYRQMYPF